MKKPTTPKTDPAATPVPHDVAVDAQTPDDPANSGAAANTPADVQNVDMKQLTAAANKFDKKGPGVQEIDDFIVVDPKTPEGKAKAAELDAAHPANATVTTDEQPKAASERMTPAAKSAPVSDGTVTVDFGKAGKLTGCLVLNSVPGAPLQYAEGQQVSVVVPNDEGGTSTISVDGKYIK